MTKPDIELPGPYNLVELFETATQKYANNLLFGTKNKAKDGYDWVTYKQVADRVDNLRGGLAKIGVEKGDGVAIIANNRVEWAVAAYATYGCCARFIPMYEAELPRIWQYIIDNSGSKILFVSSQEIYEKVKDFTEKIESLEGIYVIDGQGEGTMSGLEEIGAKEPVDSIVPDPQDIAGLIYTSGTTGSPKGVMLSHLNLACNAIAASMAFKEMNSSDRTLSFLPWAHSFGQTAELHLLVSVGASTGFAESPLTIVDDLLLVKPTMLVAVPRVFNKVYDGLQKKMSDQGGLAKKLFDMGVTSAANKRTGKAGLLDNVKFSVANKVVFDKIRAKFGGNLKLAISSSAALNPAIAEFFFDIGIPVYESWGMTELSPAHTVNSPSKYKPGSIGAPIPGSSIKIDKTYTGEDAPDGEIIAYGPNVMVGYHNMPEETQAVLREDGGLATGDRGWLDDDGFLYITGRIKEQYKLENGKYVFPAGIEEAIKLNPYFENAMVEGANKPYNVAVVVPDYLVLGPWAKQQGMSDNPEDLAENPKVHEFLMEELKKACADFARYEIPKKVVVAKEGFTTENGILTPTMKLKRRNVMKVYGDALAKLYE